MVNDWFGSVDEWLRQIQEEEREDSSWRDDEYRDYTEEEKDAVLNQQLALREIRTMLDRAGRYVGGQYNSKEIKRKLNESLSRKTVERARILFQAAVIISRMSSAEFKMGLCSGKSDAETPEVVRMKLEFMKEGLERALVKKSRQKKDAPNRKIDRTPLRNNQPVTPNFATAPVMASEKDAGDMAIEVLVYRVIDEKAEKITGADVVELSKVFDGDKTKIIEKIAMLKRLPTNLLDGKHKDKAEISKALNLVFAKLCGHPGQKPPSLRIMRGYLPD